MAARIPLKRSPPRVRMQPKGEAVLLGVCRLREEIIEKIEELLLIGVPESTAFEYIGVSRRAYFNWKRWGSDYLEAPVEERNRNHRRYAKLCIRMRKAKAEWQVRLMKRSFQAPYKATWVRDMTLLERRDRANWSRSSPNDANDQRDQFNPDESFL